MKKGLIAEFKEFVMRGNVVDLAVGVIIGAAFGKITTSLVNDVFMPAFGFLVGGMDMSKLNIVLKEATAETEAVVIGIGTFIAAVIDFLLLAVIIFLMMKLINSAYGRLEALKKPEPEPEPEPETEPAPTTEQLLAEILEELKQRPMH